MKTIDSPITLDECKDQWQEEFYWMAAPLVYGERKGYDGNNWLLQGGITMSHKDNHASMGRHWAESSSGLLLVPDAKVLSPLQCLANRAMMAHTRRLRGIKHHYD